MKAGDCPVGHASFAAVEPVRHAAIVEARGDKPAPIRPALGFDLDRTTRDDARAWAKRSHVACQDDARGLMKCTDVPPAALGMPQEVGSPSELILGFDTRGRLVDVSTMRTHVERLETARDIEGRLEAAVGAPQVKRGEFDDAHLAAIGAESLASVVYRYRDYFAEFIAMRFPSDGLVLREHYMSANN